MTFGINDEPPPASPKFQKAEFGGEKRWFSPPFSLSENGGDTDGVNFSPKTTSPKKNASFKNSRN